MAADSPIDHEPIDYTLGSMDITEQVATFNIVMRLVKWGSVGVAALLTMLTVWFGAGAGFIPAFLSAAVLMAAGVWFLRAKGESDRPHGAGEPATPSAASQRNEGWTTSTVHS